MRRRHAVLTAIAVLLAAGAGRSRAAEEAAALPAAATQVMPAMPHAMWRLDPAIRDFVGPADYDQDYNASAPPPPQEPRIAVLSTGPAPAAAAKP